MRKIFTTAIFILLTLITCAQTKTITGTWVGSLDVGVKLRLVFNISADSASSLKATMDSPDQGAKGINVSSVIFKGDSLHIELKPINGRYDGLVVNDTTVTGNWSQGPAKAALTLIKTDKIIARKRPQTPKPPINYISEDVEYNNIDKSVHFAGTLTYPNKNGIFPTVILISGSGQQDRDETIFEHKPFAVIADFLTKKGFAVLRVDDRGTGKTTGEVIKATSVDFASDVEAGIEFLKTRKQTDTKHIGLLGHSEGGLIASLIAGRRKDVDFIVLMASPGVKGSDVLTGQMQAILLSQKISYESVELYKKLYQQVISISINEKDTVGAFNKLWSYYQQWKQTATERNLVELNIKDDESTKKMLKGMMEAFSSPWMKYFLLSDATKDLVKTNAKVLALNGEKDLQVLAEPNLTGIKAALQNSKSQAFEVKTLPGLNHLFQQCTKCTVAEYGELEETINPDALTILGDWLQKEVLKK